MSVLEDIRAKAKVLHRTVILPEGNEERTLKAAQMLMRDGLANVILVEDETSIRQNAAKAGEHDLTAVLKHSPFAAKISELLGRAHAAYFEAPKKRLSQS